jgi:hypothetical protein
MSRSKDKLAEGISGTIGSVGVGTAGFGIYEFMRQVPNIPSLKGGVLESISNKGNNIYASITNQVQSDTHYVSFSSTAQQLTSLPQGNLSLFIAGALAAYAGYQFPKNPLRGIVAGVLASTIPMVARTISAIPETATQTANYLWSSGQSLAEQASYHTSGATIAGVVISCGLEGLIASLTKQMGDGERTFS